MADSAGTGLRLEWSQPQWTKRSYELRNGDVLIASMSIPGLMKYTAYVEADGSSYQFVLTGVFHRKVTIIRAPFDQEVGAMALEWNKTSILTMNDGRTYKMDRPSRWKNVWRVIDNRDRELARITAHTGIGRYRGDVVLTEMQTEGNRSGMILALMWYVVLLRIQEAAASGGG